MCVMTYTLASPIADSLYDSPKPTVLLLRGWVPGPLNFLRAKLQSEFPSCHIIEPTLLMPPFFGLHPSTLWCFDVNFCLMLLVVLGFFWALMKVWLQFETFERRIYTTFLLLCLGYWIRLMAAVTARSAIADGVEKCLREMRRRNVVLCVGFSWGAGVLSELLTRDDGLDTRPAFVLMAPVSAATAMAAMRDDAANRLFPLDSNDLVHVIHAADDPWFCPHPGRWDAVPGIKSCTLQDNHVFKSASSRRAIGEIVAALYRRKTEGEQEP